MSGRKPAVAGEVVVRALALALATLLCCAPRVGARQRVVVAALARDDAPVARARPARMAARYARMARSPFDFYRGSLALFARDAADPERALCLSRSRYALDAPAAPSLGDPHPENFGTLRGPDGALTLEPNDFDAAAPRPYLWDVRRLAVGLALAARAAGGDDQGARAVAREAALGYATAIARYAAGAPREVVRDGGGNDVLDDLFARAARDAATRRELAERTVLEGRARRLRHEPDDDGGDALGPIPAAARAALDATLAAWRSSLVTTPPEGFARVLDAALAQAGVGSGGRVRALVLVEGPTASPDDDVLLEVTELPPDEDVSARVLRAMRAAWSRPDADPLWGVSAWLGAPVQVRTESRAHRSVRVARLTGRRARAEALAGLGRVLGALVARAHAAPGGDDVAGAVARRIGADVAGFADEQGDVAMDASRKAVADWRRFCAARERLGPLLGVAPSADARDPVVEALSAP